MFKRFLGIGKKKSAIEAPEPSKPSPKIDEPRRLSPHDLSDVVSDEHELAKGTQIARAGGLANLSRYGGRLFGDAKGSGKAPYRVSVVLSQKELKARCTCFAARSRPFCKHGAALIVAWADAPESFIVAETAPPEIEAGKKKKKAVKKGKRESKDLMSQGVTQIDELARQLAVAGIASLTAERVRQIQSLGENLREFRLRRLSARTLDLTELLDTSLDGDLNAVHYTNLVVDLVLTAAKLQKHFAGADLDDAYVEELIEKTWRKKDRKPVDSLQLIEYAFLQRATSDDYTIRESRFLDATTGTHYSEKQILPAFLAKRTEPKKSYAGKLLENASGSIYPGFAPYRLDLESPGTVRALESADLDKLVLTASPDIAACVAQFRDYRKDVFAPERYPAHVRVETIAAVDGRLHAVDASGASLHLPPGASVEERFEEALARGRLRALTGDIAADMAIPTFWPIAAVVERSGRLELTSLATREPTANGTGARSWAQAARAARLSPVAISLGEIQEELANAFVTGLAGLSPRTTDSLLARLSELQLEKLAGLLRGLREQTEPSARVGDFVKLYQLMELAMLRLASAAQLKNVELRPVAGLDSIVVKPPTETLDPKAIARERSRGSLSRLEAAFHYADYFEKQPVEDLVNDVALWADGASASHLARRLAQHPDQAVAVASDILLRRRIGRTAKLTALQLLADIETEDATHALSVAAGSALADEALSCRARKVVNEPRRHEGGAKLQASITEYGSFQDAASRRAVIDEIARYSLVDAIPFLRDVFRQDPSRDVRAAAARALGKLIDPSMVEVFIEQLRNRDQDERAAKVAAKALGRLGDIRGLPPPLGGLSQQLEERRHSRLPFIVRNPGRRSVARLRRRTSGARKAPSAAQRSFCFHNGRVLR